MPNIIKQKEKPSPIQKLGNNTYYFNYGIKPVMLLNSKTNEVTSGWEFIQVYLQGQPNYKDCVKAIIRSYVTQEEEFDLINSFNKQFMNNRKISSEVSKYNKYLDLLDSIKNNVKKDFNNEN